MKLITPKEQRVLEFIGAGYSTNKIAELMEISVNTVNTHRKSLLKKFDAANSAQLILKAIDVFVKAKSNSKKGL